MKVPPVWRQTPPEAEGADDEAASAKEAPRALKENPYEVGSVGACGATGDDCAR